MAYTFSVVGWKGWDNRNHGGVPPRPQDARGVRVLFVNPDDETDTRQHWTMVLAPLEDWSEWWVFIGAMAVGNHGMELADEPPADDNADDNADDGGDSGGDGGGGDGGFYDDPPRKPGLIRRITRGWR